MSILGKVVGGIAGSLLGGGKKKSESTATSEPWAGQQPYLKKGFGEAERLYQSGGPAFYPEATYVPFSAPTEAALGMAEQRAMGSPAEQALGGYLNQTLQGGYLGANPYLDAQYDAAARRVTDNFQNAVMPALAAQFGGAGGSGSQIQQQMALDASDVLGQNLSDMAANIYGTDYGRERGLMSTAAGMVPLSSALDWQNINRLGGVGAAIEGKAGDVLSDAMARFNYYQGRPEDNLARFIAAIQGNYGGQTTSTATSPGGSRLAGALGGAMLGHKIDKDGLGSFLEDLFSDK